MERNILIKVANLMRLRNQHSQDSEIWKSYDKQMWQEMEFCCNLK
jgi:hypothetical protein